MLRRAAVVSMNVLVEKGKAKEKGGAPIIPARRLAFYGLARDRDAAFN
jgi:hypothetical protein